MKKELKNKYIEHFIVVVLTIALTLLIFMLMGMFELPVVSQSDNQGPQRFIVEFSDDEALNQGAWENLERRFGAVRFNLVNGAFVYLPHKAAAWEVLDLPGVTAMYPDAKVHAFEHRPGHNPGSPGREAEPDQTISWGVDRVGAPDVWSENTGEGVKVAVIDTGVQLNHPDLNIAGAVDCTKGRSCGTAGTGGDDHGHGTHVAGIISALNNDFGVVGVSPSADIYSVKVLGRDGTGFLGDVIQGIEWAVMNDMQVANLSLGNTANVGIFEDVLNIANESGVLLVASAGNNGGEDNAPVYPASYESVISVGAISQSGSLADFSNTSSNVELVAPGVDIFSTALRGEYGEQSGTSVATPHVSAVAALVWALDGTLSNSDVRQILGATAEDLGLSANEQGNGLVRADWALLGD